MRLPLSLLTLLCATAFPAIAQEVPLERPAECGPVLTVQFKGCEVTTYLACEGQDGGYFREESTDADGAMDVSHGTTDGLLIGVAFGGHDTALIGILKGATSTSLTVLHETGQGYWRQDGLVRLYANFTRPFSMEMTASADGIKLLGDLDQFDMQGSMQLPPPMDPIKMTGKIYLHRDLGIVIEGESTASWTPDGDGTLTEAPARLIYPGEPGFDTATPEIDCNQLSLLSPQPASRHS